MEEARVVDLSMDPITVPGKVLRPNTNRETVFVAVSMLVDNRNTGGLAEEEIVDPQKLSNAVRLPYSSANNFEGRPSCACSTVLLNDLTE